MTEQNNGQDTTQDGDESIPGNGEGQNGAGGSSQDGLDDDSLLDALLADDDSDESDEDDEEEDADDKTKEDPKVTKPEDKQVYKIGDRTFNSVEELSTWAAKQNGKVQDLIGQLKEAKKGSPEDRDALKKEIKEELAREAQVDNWKGQVDKFWGDFPEAKDYREEMATFLRKGKANDEDGKPSLAIAYAKALKADDKEIPSGLLDGVKKEEAFNETKTVMGAGNGRGSLSNAGYNTKEDVARVSDEGDQMIFGGR